MFKLADPDQAYDRVVQIQMPSPDGATQTASYTALFRMLSNAAIAEKTDEEIVRAALVGWKDIEDHTGKPLPFSAENLQTLLAIGYWQRGTALDYVKFINGLPAGN